MTPDQELRLMTQIVAVSLAVFFVFILCVSVAIEAILQ